MNILVIGGTKFIGPRVVSQLLAGGHQVALFHRGQSETAVPPEVQHIHGDRKQLDEFAEEFKKLHPDVVLDMICMAESDAVKVVEVFRTIAGRLVMLSSMDVYRAYAKVLGLEEGPPDAIPLNEDSPLRTALYPYRDQAKGPDDSAYHYDKIPIEKVVLAEKQLKGTVLRLPAVYGPGDYQHRVGEYLKVMDAGPRVELEAGREGWKWTRGYVENVAAAITLAVTDSRAAGRVYNVGEEAAPTEVDWIRTIAKAAGWPGRIEKAGEGKPWLHHIEVDTSRIRRELQYRDIVPLDEAMRITVEWERSQFRSPKTS